MWKWLFVFATFCLIESNLMKLINNMQRLCEYSIEYNNKYNISILNRILYRIFFVISPIVCKKKELRDYKIK